jgi:hypothetical protein
MGGESPRSRDERPRRSGTARRFGCPFSAPDRTHRNELERPYWKKVGNFWVRKRERAEETNQPRGRSDPEPDGAPFSAPAAAASSSLVEEPRASDPSQDSTYR